MNATIEKFGWPATLVADHEHWVVLLRPTAPTLGSLVLAAKGEATAFSDLPAAAFAEQAGVIAGIERTLKRAVDYARINYLMLMMVDPNVHFHVIPRYEGSRTFEGVDFPDSGWPKMPDLNAAKELDQAMIAAQVAWLKGLWPSS